ncbi:MAG: hypothetical protein HAW67_03905 [Endozoicomonadaceae bacterium]|nr:hypothetical protein [Endozoicomonadaceae bacterium]
MDNIANQWAIGVVIAAVLIAIFLFRREGKTAQDVDKNIRNAQQPKPAEPPLYRQVRRSKNGHKVQDINTLLWVNLEDVQESFDDFTKKVIMEQKGLLDSLASAPESSCANGNNEIPMHSVQHNIESEVTSPDCGSSNDYSPTSNATDHTTSSVSSDFSSNVD